MIGVGWRGRLALRSDDRGGVEGRLPYSSRVRRRRIRPPASSARPPRMTGMAAKPVNGSWLLVAAASWRVGCVLVASAGATPPVGLLPPAGVVPPDECDGPLPPPDSAGRTPPSGVGVHSACVCDGDVLPPLGVSV